MEGYLNSRGLRDLTFAGLATDYCVAFSALDAIRQGFKVTVDTRLCRAINMDESLELALSKMESAKVSVV